MMLSNSSISWSTCAVASHSFAVASHSFVLASRAFTLVLAFPFRPGVLTVFILELGRPRGPQPRFVYLRPAYGVGWRDITRLRVVVAVGASAGPNLILLSLHSHIGGELRNSWTTGGDVDLCRMGVGLHVTLDQCKERRCS